MDRQAKKKEQERKLEEKKAAAAAKKKRLEEEKRIASAERLRAGSDSSDPIPSAGATAKAAGDGNGAPADTDRTGLPPWGPKGGSRKAGANNVSDGDAAAKAPDGTPPPWALKTRLKPRADKTASSQHPKADAGKDLSDPSKSDSLPAPSSSATVDTVDPATGDGTVESPVTPAASASATAVAAAGATDTPATPALAADEEAKAGSGGSKKPDAVAAVFCATKPEAQLAEGEADVLSGAATSTLPPDSVNTAGEAVVQDKSSPEPAVDTVGSAGDNIPEASRGGGSAEPLPSGVTKQGEEGASADDLADGPHGDDTVCGGDNAPEAATDADSVPAEQTTKAMVAADNKPLLASAETTAFGKAKTAEAKDEIDSSQSSVPVEEVPIAAANDDAEKLAEAPGATKGPGRKDENRKDVNSAADTSPESIAAANCDAEKLAKAAGATKGPGRKGENGKEVDSAADTSPESAAAQGEDGACTHGATEPVKPSENAAGGVDKDGSADDVAPAIDITESPVDASAVDQNAVEAVEADSCWGQDESNTVAGREKEAGEETQSTSEIVPPSEGADTDKTDAKGEEGADHLGEKPPQEEDGGAVAGDIAADDVAATCLEKPAASVDSSLAEPHPEPLSKSALEEGGGGEVIIEAQGAVNTGAATADDVIAAGEDYAGKKSVSTHEGDTAEGSGSGSEDGSTDDDDDGILLLRRSGLTRAGATSDLRVDELLGELAESRKSKREGSNQEKVSSTRSPSSPPEPATEAVSPDTDEGSSSVAKGRPPPLPPGDENEADSGIEGDGVMKENRGGGLSLAANGPRLGPKGWARDGGGRLVRTADGDSADADASHTYDNSNAVTTADAEDDTDAVAIAEVNVSSDAKADADVIPDADARVNAKVDVEVHADVDVKTGAKAAADANAETDPGADVDANADAGAGPRADAAADVIGNADAEADAGVDDEAKVGVEAGEEAEADAGTDVNAEENAQADVSADGGAILDADADVIANADAEAELGVAANVSADGAAIFDPIVGVITNAEAGAEAGAEADAEASAEAGVEAGANAEVGLNACAEVNSNANAGREEEGGATLAPVRVGEEDPPVPRENGPARDVRYSLDGGSASAESEAPAPEPVAEEAAPHIEVAASTADDAPANLETSPQPASTTISTKISDNARLKNNSSFITPERSPPSRLNSDDSEEVAFKREQPSLPGPAERRLERRLGESALPEELEEGDAGKTPDAATKPTVHSLPSVYEDLAEASWEKKEEVGHDGGGGGGGSGDGIDGADPKSPDETEAPSAESLVPPVDRVAEVEVRQSVAEGTSPPPMSGGPTTVEATERGKKEDGSTGGPSPLDKEPDPEPERAAPASAKDGKGKGAPIGKTRKMSAAAARKKRRHQERLEAKNKALLECAAIDQVTAAVTGDVVVSSQPAPVSDRPDGDSGAASESLDEEKKGGRDQISEGEAGGGSCGINGDVGRSRCGSGAEVGHSDAADDAHRGTGEGCEGGEMEAATTAAAVGAAAAKAAAAAAALEGRNSEDDLPLPKRNSSLYTSGNAITSQPTGDF